MKSCCILVTGIPASGKSTMAKYLSKELGIPMFSKDEIKERLFDALGFQSREEKVRLGVAAMEIMYDAARSCLSCGQSVILENNFENTSKPGLAALLDEYPCNVITVMMTGDLRTIYERFAERDRSPLRHRGHVVNDHYPEEPGTQKKHVTIPFEVFEQSMAARGMDRQPWNSACIQVDATDLNKIDSADVAVKLRAYMQ